MTAAGAYRTLFNFADGAAGYHPSGKLVLDGAGDLFGTTTDGGANNHESLFEFAAGATAPSTLYVYSDSHSSIAIDGQGDVFGADQSSIFEIPHGTSGVTVLAAVPSGDSLAALAVDGQGNIFGGGYIPNLVKVGSFGGGWNSSVTNNSELRPDLMTIIGNAGSGLPAFFELPFGSSTLQTLATPGASTLVVDANDTVYGSGLTAGGDINYSSLLELSAGSNTTLTLRNFEYDPAGLAIDGTGTVFAGETQDLQHSDLVAVSPAGAKNVIYTRDDYTSGGADSLATDAAGNVYWSVGSPSAGQIIKLSPVTIAEAVITQGPAAVAYWHEPAGTVTVELRDAQGNLVDTNASVTLKANGASIGGTYSVAAVHGVATFTDFSFADIGNFPVVAESGDVTSAPSAAVTVKMPHLVFTSLPTDAVAGKDFSVQVAVEDDAGNIFTSDTSQILVYIQSPANKTLTNGNRYNAVNGVATFTGLQFNEAGEITLGAEGPYPMGPVTSAPVTIHPDVASARLGWADSRVKKIALKDQYGNVLTDANGKVTVSVSAAPAGGKLSGKRTIRLVEGVGSFTDLDFTQAGHYMLHFMAKAGKLTASYDSGWWMPNRTPGFSETQVAASYAAGRPVTVTTRLSVAAGHPPFSGTASLVDENNKVVAVAPVARSGLVKFRVLNVAPGAYRWTVSYGGDSDHATATSDPLAIVVTPAKSRISLKASPVQADGSTTLTAHVAGIRGEVPTGTVMFLAGDTAVGNATLDASGTAVISLTPSAGVHDYVAVYAGDGWYASSSSRVVRVRRLVSTALVKLDEGSA